MAAEGDVERLVVLLEARIRDFEKNLQKASGTADRTFAQMRRDSRSATQQMEADMARSTSRINQMLASTSTRIGAYGKSMAVGLAAGLSVRAAQELIDSATKITNALKVAGLSGDDLAKVYDRLFEAAQKNAAPIETLVELYARAALQQKELGVSTDELLKFTDDVALALRVAGTDAQAASGALLQLSQALGSGTVRAEEFNSILEGAPTIAQAVAAGLKEAGGSVAKLHSLVVDGKVSSAAFFRAFEAGSYTLRDKVADAEMTVSQQFIRLRNVLVDVAGKLNDATGAGDTAGRGLSRLADVVEAVGDVIQKTADGPLGTFIGKMGQVIDLVNKYALLGNIRDMIWNPDNIKAAGTFLNGGTEIDKITAKIQTLQRELNATGMAGAVMGDKDALRAEIKRLESQRDALLTKSTTTPPAAATSSKPGTVSLDDYPVTGGKKKGTKERADDYQRLTQRIVDATAAQVAETEAQRQLNPLVKDYGYAAEKARTERELLTAAEKAGKTVTPALRAEIASLADQYATAGAEAAKLAEEHGKMVEEMQFKKGIWLGVAQDFREALSDGKLEMQELGQIALNVFDKIIDKLLNEVLDAIFQVNDAFDPWGGMRSTGGGDIFSFLGNLFGGIFGGGWAGLRLAGGGSVRGPGTDTSDSIPAMLSNGEFIVNAKAARKNRGILEAINDGLKLDHFALGGAVPGYAAGGTVDALMPPAPSRSPQGGTSQPAKIEVTIGVSVDKNGNLMPFVKDVSSKTAAVVVKTAAPSIIQGAVTATQNASRNRPGFFR